MAVLAARSARFTPSLGVLQLAALAIVLAVMPFKQFDLDRYFVPKELVLHLTATLAAVACLTAVGPLTLSLVDLLLSAFAALSVCSSLLATNLWAAERATAITLSGALVFWTASRLRVADRQRALLGALAVGIVVAAATSLAQAYGVTSEYFSLNRAPGGTFGNRNFIAHLAAIGLPVLLLVSLTARRAAGSVASVVGLAIVAAALVLSRSRGAWLAALAAAVVIAVVALLTRAKWADAQVGRRMVRIMVALAAGALGGLFLPNRLEWKSDSPYLESATGLVNYKEGSGKGRLVQYGASLRMAKAHPLLGVGPGNWSVVYPRFAHRDDPSMAQESGMTANPWPSSDWVAFLSERGPVATTLLLAAFVGLGIRALRDLAATPHDPERALTAIALIGTLIAALVAGAFDAVLLVAAPAFFVWALLGAMAPVARERVRVALPAGATSMVAIAVATIGLLLTIRSGAQALAIQSFSASSKLAATERAAMLDPGSYRIRMRLVALYVARRDCRDALVQARAVAGLYPSAAEPRREIAACGGR